MNTYEFAFAPFDYVVITLLGTNYRGRVVRCLYDGSNHIYDVQYANDTGEFKRAEFYEDEVSTCTY